VTDDVDGFVFGGAMSEDDVDAALGGLDEKLTLLRMRMREVEVDMQHIVETAPDAGCHALARDMERALGTTNILCRFVDGLTT